MFRFTARTMLELGSELISSDIIAFYELIKNGIDAGSVDGVSIAFNSILPWQSYRELSRKAGNPNADIDALKDALKNSLNSASDYSMEDIEAEISQARSPKSILEAIEAIYRKNSITVSDTGSGMNMDTLASVFLVIGTGSRKGDVEDALKAGETKVPYMGEKGLGRLSAMRLGHRLNVVTATKDDTHYSCLDIDWRLFDRHDILIEDIDVEPTRGVRKKPGEGSGTRIIISDLTANWTLTRLQEMAEREFALLYDPFEEIRRRPKIRLFWNGDRVDVPAMDRDLLEHAHAKVSGKYEVKDGEPSLTYRIDLLDLGYEHPVETDILKLERADLIAPLIGKYNEIDESALESVGPFTFEAYWFNRRRLGAIDSIGDKKQVKQLQQKWTGIRLYRDGFRVFPYGEEDDDWLSLDRTALMSKGYLLNKIQFIGRVNIGRLQNPHLIDQTSREGLRETPEQKVLLFAAQYVIQRRLRDEMNRLDNRYKKQRTKALDPSSELKTIAKRARSSMEELRKTANSETRETVDELRQTLLNLLDFSDRAQQRIEEVEADSRQMIDLAGIGLLVEVVAHELARSTETALDNIAALKRSDASQEQIAKKLESLRNSMNAINKRLRVLDPLSVSGRNRSETFDLTELVRETFEAHKSQFERHHIELVLEEPHRPLFVTAVKGYVVQVLENLISNSVYWLDLEVRSNKLRSFVPKIKVEYSSDPTTIYFQDNGPGIHRDHREKVFELFYSTKEIKRRRGLGLYIARDAAEQNGGTLELDEDLVSPSKRLNRFIYTFAE